MRFRKIYFVILFASVLTCHANYDFIGETLDFEVKWGFITAGNARMSVKKAKNSANLDISTRAWNNGAFETIFPVNDTVHSLVRAENLSPISFMQNINEGSYARKAMTRYDFTSKKATIADTVFASVKNKKEYKYTLDTIISLEGNEHSILSAFYLARTMKHEPGKSVNFNAIGVKNIYRLKVICHRREIIDTPLGKKKCLVIEPIIQGDGLFRAKGELLIWLTDDEDRLPVLMKSKIKVGSISVKLIGVNKI